MTEIFEIIKISFFIIIILKGSLRRLQWVSSTEGLSEWLSRASNWLLLLKWILEPYFIFKLVIYTVMQGKDFFWMFSFLGMLEWLVRSPSIMKWCFWLFVFRDWRRFYGFLCLVLEIDLSGDCFFFDQLETTACLDFIL